MAKQTKMRTKVPEKAKKRAAQVNMMQRSSDEMGKFDNTSATSVPMAITALMGLGFEVALYILTDFSSFGLHQDHSRLLLRRGVGSVPFDLSCLLVFCDPLLQAQKIEESGKRHAVQAFAGGYIRGYPRG